MVREGLINIYIWDKDRANSNSLNFVASNVEGKEEQQRRN